MSALTPEVLAQAQAVANVLDHEDHDEAVRVALELVSPLLEARARLALAEQAVTAATKEQTAARWALSYAEMRVRAAVEATK